MSSWLLFSLYLARSLDFYTLVQLVNFALLVILTLLFVLVLLSANHSGLLGPSRVTTSFQCICCYSPSRKRNSSCASPHQFAPRSRRAA
ncbi:hypothetical protein HETIRDRAFT_310571 [Heterobasidion irregulare TC 32-1]|uniref:Uncharacterized protein n=1 Tax=Heterobasidion irregulare (strain TC 32-1) TaxID=747525 RepID=W4KJK1_HETIT|nr:uncharacterized protein HETIRDRAFT_310571 [Heterobasidion irregulare TC 32-1]ETW85241.1 hypothetical protein HETIRDRAFT_310571 [Heterobasidion irregulare TC 32-1]